VTLVLEFPRTQFRKRRSIQHDLSEVVKELRGQNGLKVHVGCGEDYIPGFCNVDLFSAVADVKAPAWDLSCLETESAQLVEAHHVIEHLSFEESNRSLAEWHRVLQSGGWIIVSCPDMDRIVRRWNHRRHQVSDLLAMIYGSQEHPGMFHRSGYTNELLRSRLEAQQFSVRFAYTPFPPRPTPSLCIFAQKR
jgi:predicted SAM-dependent methyltransferase